MLEEGFYYLTADVVNPKPDRRSKRMDSVVTWPKGTRVYVKPPTVTKVGQVEWRDGSVSYYSNAIADPIYRQANFLVENLEPAPLTLGQFFAKSYITPLQALAYLMGESEVTFNMLRRAERVVGADEYDINALEKKHEI